MRKKGFSLIELVAVIVILGVVALITTPIVLNIIKETSKISFKTNSLSAFRAAQLYEAENDFDLISNEGISITSSLLPIEGGGFTSGKIIKNKNNEFELINVTNGVYCAKGTKDELVIIEGECSLLDDTAPTDIYIAVDNLKSNSLRIIVSANDFESGIKEYQYSIDGVNYIKNTNNTFTFDKLNKNQEYTVYVKVVNNNNITSEVFTRKITTLDIEAPTYSVDKTGWQVQKTLTINYPVRQEDYIYQYSIDGGSTWETVTTGTTHEIVFNNNGAVIARIYDGTNYKTASSYIVSQIDNSAPSASVALSSKTTNSITVAASGSDSESGITKYEFSINGGAYISNGTNTIYTFTNIISGSHCVKVRTTNGSGLTTESTVLTVSPNDITAPTYAIDKTGWQTSKIVTITYPTRQTGFVYQYSINGGTSWTTVSSGVTETVTFNVNGAVVARIYDGTNYKTASSYTVPQIDSTAPTSSVALSSKTTNTITALASGTDAESGITKYEFSIDGNSYINNGANTIYTFTGVTSGSHSIKIRTTNGSGLTTESTVLTVSPNEIAVPTYAINKTGWQTSKIVTITYPTRQTGFVYEYSINGGTSWTTVASGTTANVTFNNNGTVIARIYDGINYKTASSYTVSQIDTTAPTADVILSSKTTNSITVAASGADAESGITKYEFSIDGGAYVSNGTNATYTFTGVTTGNHTVRVRTTNGIGLTTESSVLTVSPNEITVPIYSVNKTGWQTQKIVTITYPTRETGFVYQYSINGGTSWTTVSSGVSGTVTFNANGSVIARIYDGTNYKIASSYTVSQIDNSAPSASVALSSKTNNTITVIASGTDSESGITKYEFSIDGGAYINNGTIRTYTFMGISGGVHTIKVRVTNGAGTIRESLDLVLKVCEATKGNGTKIGDEITCGSESFYVYSNDGTNIKMLAKYNLYVGGIYNSSWVPYGSEATGLQDITMLGGLPGQNISRGTTAFSSDIKKGVNYSDYNGSIVKSYIDQYALKLLNMGVSASEVTLITKEELEVLGCSSNNYSCSSSSYVWLYSTSYWTRSAISTYGIWGVGGGGANNEQFISTYYSREYDLGVRPVVKILSSSI